MEKKLSFNCPVCARNTDYPVSRMVEGAVITCPYCNLSITLHGHMLQYVQREIERLKEEKD